MFSPVLDLFQVTTRLFEYECRLYDIYTIGNMQNVLMTINTIRQ